jgi:hypothetical protein
MKFRSTYSLILLLFVLLFGACKEDDEPTDPCIEHEVGACGTDSAKTNIRIQNISTYEMCNVVLNTCCGDVNMGIVAPNATTCYHVFDSTYAYSYVRLTVDAKEFKLQPIDYVGESTLPLGNYTLKLNVTDYANRQLSMEYVPD